VKRSLALILLFVAAAGSSAAAADLYPHDGWAALASDRTARNVGDILTVNIYQSSSAVNSANSSSKRSTDLGGHLVAGQGFSEPASLDMTNNSGDTGSTGRSGGIVAQLSVTVDDVLPNGDLQISGAQYLNINGEKTQIRVKGRVRLADISGTNTIVSNRIADATIDYDGAGFVSRSAAPGLVGRIFNWLGLP
jgi:flagellar L-ring protein precursor FlgH